jgi:hypothetical protein
MFEVYMDGVINLSKKLLISIFEESIQTSEEIQYEIQLGKMYLWDSS